MYIEDFLTHVLVFGNGVKSTHAGQESSLQLALGVGIGKVTTVSNAQLSVALLIKRGQICLWAADYVDENI